MYGDVELNTEVMGHIESGEIPVVSNAFKNAVNEAFTVANSVANPSASVT